MRRLWSVCAACSRLRGGRLFDRTRRSQTPRAARQDACLGSLRGSGGFSYAWSAGTCPPPANSWILARLLEESGAPRGRSPSARRSHTQGDAQPGGHRRLRSARGALPPAPSSSLLTSCTRRAGWNTPTHTVAGERHHSYRTAAGQTRALVGAHSTRRSRASCSHGSSEAQHGSAACAATCTLFLLQVCGGCRPLS